MSANTVVFQSNINIGQMSAEFDDEFLFQTFVDHPSLASLRDLESPEMFALGSTGIGKTALLRMIEHQEENCASLELHEMAMNHITNSDTILFMQSLDVDLSLFFQALWKHVLCIEYIKLLLKEKDRDNWKFLVERILGVGNRTRIRERLEEFVEDNHNRFWNTIDENVIELTDGLESSVKAELGVEIKKFVGSAGYARTLGVEKKTQLKNRAKKFVDQSIVSGLAQVIGALSQYTQGRADRYFIVIDGLDENWVEDSIKYQLIQALFEALKPLRKLRNFKVIVALRNDIYEQMLRDSDVSRGQKEKYNDLVIKVRWTRAQLEELAQKRINYLFRKKYSSENVTLHDIVPDKADGKVNSFTYLLERTMYRPRDVIAFLNAALQAAEGKTSISRSNFLKGELSYSQSRLEALESEWSSTFPGIKYHLELLRNGSDYFMASELMQSKIIDDVYDKLGRKPSTQTDTLWQMVNRSMEGGSLMEPNEVVGHILFRLHICGAVGLKLNGTDPWNWMFLGGIPSSPEEITAGTKVKLNPMLYSSLGVRLRKAHLS